MEPKLAPGDWQTAISNIYQQLIQYLVSYLPQLLGAFLLVLAGWLIALLLSRVTLTLLSLTNRLLIKLLPESLLKKGLEIKPAHARIASRVIFWMAMLFFIAAASSIMGLDFFATWIGQFLGYLPHLLAGLLIILGGYLLGNALNVMTTATAESAGFQRPHLAGASVQLAVLFTALVIGIEQLGINIQFVTRLFVVVAGVLLAGVALAFGLGARSLIANIIGSQQALKHCRLKDHLKILGIEGTLVEVTGTMLVIETENGRTMVPARKYLEEVSSVSKTGTTLKPQTDN